MAKKPKCVIVGGSHSAAQLVTSLRQQGWDGNITVISEELFLPYHRPPLSKGYLLGEKTSEDLLIRPPSIYEKNNTSFVLGLRAWQLDRLKKMVVFENLETITYDKLVLTTGSNVRRLKVPGATLDGVFYLRTIRDVEKIKGYVGEGKKAVVIGGGYIGLETAAVLNQLGMKVTVLEAMERVLQRVTTEEISSFYTRVHEEEGVKIVTDSVVAGIEGEKSVEHVITKDGTKYEANLVIAGIGVSPSTKLAEDAGLEVNNGIVVNEFAQTNDPDILAAGDCTNHYNPIYDRHIRLESVQNAVDQATTAAGTICGKPKPYNTLPWFWSDQYDLKLQIAGLSEGHDKVLIRGDLAKGRSFAAFYLKNGKVIAVDAVNKPLEFTIGKRLIMDRVTIDQSLLTDEETSIKDLLNKV